MSRLKLSEWSARGHHSDKSPHKKIEKVFRPYFKTPLDHIKTSLDHIKTSLDHIKTPLDHIVELKIRNYDSN